MIPAPATSPVHARSLAASGFTLIELMVALLLTGMVLLIARALFAQVMVGADAIERDRVAGAHRRDREWLLEACRGIEVGTPGTTGFSGTAQKAAFTTRVLSSRGWTELRPAEVTLDGDGLRVRAGGIDLQLVDSIGAGGLDYLADPEGGGGWVVGWESPVSAPLAIRMKWSRGGVVDSLLCPIGQRQ